MKSQMISSPLIIKTDAANIYGVLRTSETCDKLLVMIPALTGTRTGPQNIYVDIARSTVPLGVACLCVEFPPSGDSYNHPSFNNQPETLDPIKAFESYLKMVHAFIVENYSFNNIFYGSISLGCLPLYKYLQSINISGAVLLSPTHANASTSVVDKQNMRSYVQKIFMARTWKKLFLLRINFKKVFKNVIKKPAARDIAPGNKPLANDVKTLCVFGEKDAELADYLQYWKSRPGFSEKEKIKVEIIKGADHSFFGWNYKKQVCAAIVNWL